MELVFKSDTTQRKWRFTNNSFAHPAKMMLPLQLWLIEHYTKPGDWILDPMGGSGTLLVACSLSRNVILVELEDKFVQMQKDNWKRVQEVGCELGHMMGKAVIMQGDARRLHEMLAPIYEGAGVSQIQKVSAIISSPPYTNRMDGGMRGSRAGMIPYTNESPDSWFTTRDQNNIGNLPYGKIDSIITSPPYEGSVSASTGGERDQSSARQREARLLGKGYDPTKYQGGVGRNLEIDFQYSKADDNIGNLKGNTYLEAMSVVYSQCHAVLKDGGLMILVTKNFIREKEIVNLDTDTIKICEQSGFELMERHYRKLTQQSFWRTIYKQKYPDAPEIITEDVLVFRRSND